MHSETHMTRTTGQIAADMAIAKMRLDQARAKLNEAALAGNMEAQARLEKVEAAAAADYAELKQERAAHNRAA